MLGIEKMLLAKLTVALLNSKIGFTLIVSNYGIILGINSEIAPRFSNSSLN